MWKSLRAGLVTSTLLALSASPASASPVSIANSLNGATGYSAYAHGEGVTTPTGGPWSNITFSWIYNNSGTNEDVAFGTLYLLSQPYAGTPSGLSTSTPHFIASATASGGVYTFASNVVLNSSTEYYFYCNANPGSVSETATETSAFVSGGQGPQVQYIAAGSLTSANFAASTSSSDNNLFQLSGTAVPEPATLVQACTAMFFGLGYMLRKREVKFRDNRSRSRT